MWATTMRASLLQTPYKSTLVKRIIEPSVFSPVVYDDTNTLHYYGEDIAVLLRDRTSTKSEIVLPQSQAIDQR